MKETMQPTVVLLLSDKRSGSTILQQELCKHAGVKQVDYSPHTYEETQHWLKGAALLDMPGRLYYGHKVYPTYKNKAVARTYLVDEIKSNLPDFNCDISDRDLVFQGWEALCRKYAQPVFFEKSPQHIAQWAALSLMLEWIKTTEFRVKVVGLVRNPLSVLYSAEELFLSNPEVRQFGWMDMYHNLIVFREMIPSDKFHLVRYEDLIAKPVGEFGKILEFIGMPENDQIGRTVHDKSANKWRDDPRFTVRLHESVKQTARYFGYTDDELDNPVKPERPWSEKLANVIRHRRSRFNAIIKNQIIRPILLRLKRN